MRYNHYLCKIKSHLLIIQNPSPCTSYKDYIEIYDNNLYLLFLLHVYFAKKNSDKIMMSTYFAVDMDTGVYE